MFNETKQRIVKNDMSFKKPQIIETTKDLIKLVSTGLQADV